MVPRPLRQGRSTACPTLPGSPACDCCCRAAPFPPPKNCTGDGDHLSERPRERRQQDQCGNKQHQPRWDVLSDAALARAPRRRTGKLRHFSFRPAWKRKLALFSLVRVWKGYKARGSRRDARLRLEGRRRNIRYANGITLTFLPPPGGRIRWRKPKVRPLFPSSRRIFSI